ncbi:MAG TPA: DUF5615 family PIN-like protein [Thermoanaerobaculia bacterium]|nr:DUF5615 family PIN-like protein [Thermoanaerobaculia bacterium]
MRLLLDESLPRLLAHELRGHECSTVQSLGWSGIGNGVLLQQAAEHGFEAFLTPDRGFEFQQNPLTLPLVVVILRDGGPRAFRTIDHISR